MRSEIDRHYDDEMIQIMELATHRSKLKQELTILLNQIDLKRLPFNMRFQLTPISKLGYGLSLLCSTKDPFTRKPVTTVTDIFTYSKAPTLSHLSQQVRETIHVLMTHEADELLFVDGEQVFDPHKDDPK